MASTISHTLLNPRLNYCCIYRYLRSLSHKTVGPKVIKGKVKNVKRIPYEEPIYNYKDFMKKAKYTSVVDNELDITEDMTTGEDYSHVLQNYEKYYDSIIEEEKAHKRNVKKAIIARKYFNHHLETNLLTCAAKEQIIYLHQHDPVKWSPEILADTFPISLSGVKKLLRSNFTIDSPEKRKEHDEEVFENWKALKSGDLSSIAFRTQQLWKAGKLIPDNFMGNPNFPTGPLKTSKTIMKKKQEEHGEFSAIVKSYVDYKKKNIKQNTDCSETVVFKKGASSKVKDIECKLNQGFCAPEEFDNENISLSKIPKKFRLKDDEDIPLQEFKENVLCVSESESKSSIESAYEEWCKKQNTIMPSYPDKKQTTGEVFTKISKYANHNSFQLKKDKGKYDEHLFVYDKNSGNLHPQGQIFKPNIKVPQKFYKKGNIYRVGQCVYDDNGELLYKI